MKKQNLVLVKQSMKNSKSGIYKWVSKSMAENIIHNNTNDDISYEYASWHITLLYKVKYFLFKFSK